MTWAKDYYTKQSRTFASGAITERHREIAGRVHGWCTRIDGCRNVLELGAGAGGTAAALADHGYDVCAVDFNPSDAALARRLAALPRPGALRIVEADFYEVQLDRQFDFVFQWDGFGIGTDAEQRRLLRRIGTEWLAPRGRALIDVFSPWNWMRQDGETSVYTALDGAQWQRTVAFDAVASRFRDYWEPLPDGGERRSQSIRCYSIPEFRLLLEGTSLVVEEFLGMDGRRIEDDDESLSTERYLRETNGYYAMLVGA